MIDRHWRAAGAAGACLLAGWLSYGRGGQVPLLAYVDLGFHELGHLLTYPLPDLITALMGSVTQVAVPLGLAAYFLVVRHEALSAAVCTAWAGTSARDVSVYVADAPYERLQLIGGDHDWAFILHETNHMSWASGLATLVRLFGLILIIAGLGLCAWEATIERPGGRSVKPHGNPARDPRDGGWR